MSGGYYSLELERAARRRRSTTPSRDDGNRASSRFRAARPNFSRRDALARALGGRGLRSTSPRAPFPTAASSAQRASATSTCTRASHTPSSTGACRTATSSWSIRRARWSSSSRPRCSAAAHYNAAFKALMALCGAATIVVVALLLVRLGARRRRDCGAALAAPRALADRARADLAQHLRRVARVPDGRCAGGVARRLGVLGSRAARARVRGQGLSARARAARRSSSSGGRRGAIAACARGAAFVGRGRSGDRAVPRARSRTGSSRASAPRRAVRCRSRASAARCSASPIGSAGTARRSCTAPATRSRTTSPGRLPRCARLS